MANSDYKKTGNGNFANIIVLDAPLDRIATLIHFTQSSVARPIVAGMAAMVDDEIMLVEAATPNTITVKRGCADTIPAPHSAERIAWIFDTSAVGTDRKEWNAGETIGVKVSPYTVAGTVPTSTVPPFTVNFNWRVARPYPPAKLMVNGVRWFENPAIDDATPALTFSWAHRDRVIQADRLIGHEDASVGPEPGVTYTLRIYDPITDSVVRSETGIAGPTFTYQRSQATFDQGYPSEVLTPYFTLAAVRDGLESYQAYLGDFSLTPSAEIDSNYMPFESKVFETPYTLNAIYGLTPSGNFTLGLAARPSDRMSDLFDLISNGALAVGGVAYVPWITLDFKLPELETVVNVRSSSLFDGVSLDGIVGMLALIDDELVLVKRVISGKQIEITRGCCDTVPASHVAGSRVWIFHGGAVDTLSRNGGDVVQYKFRPHVYGPQVPLADLPVYEQNVTARSSRPYPPGQLVVNGRPWFEEVQVISDGAVVFSWARRNRIAQGATILGHADGDVAPEAGQVTSLTFYYKNGTAMVTLRTVDVAGTGYTYDYAAAQADGTTAGTALGICGSVVIYCEIRSHSGSNASYAGYTVPIRVPSYPC